MSFGIRLCSKLRILSDLPRMVHSCDFKHKRPALLKHNSSISFEFVKIITNDVSLSNIYELKNENKQSKFSECRVPGHDDVSGTKLIAVSIVGTPNAGKSTLINRLINRRVCPVSSKVHTTRNKAKAILSEGNIQVVLLDTPGLVDVFNSKRHNLEKSFLVDAELCIKESDLIAVVHDVSNVWTRDRLDVKILRLLHLHRDKSSVLILNKVDAVKSRRKLLDLTHSLTCGSLKSDIIENDDQLRSTLLSEECAADTSDNSPYSEKAIHEAVVNATGWSKFERVFMISALTGNGVNDVKEFILQKGIPRPWMYPSTVFTDQNIEEMVILAVKEKLLEFLPKEIPYNVKICLEHLNVSSAGDVAAVVLLYCNNKRQEKLLIGTHGKKIREIAKAAEEALENTLMENVRLKIAVKSNK